MCPVSPQLQYSVKRITVIETSEGLTPSTNDWNHTEANVYHIRNISNVGRHPSDIHLEATKIGSARKADGGMADPGSGIVRSRRLPYPIDQISYVGHEACPFGARHAAYNSFWIGGCKPANQCHRRCRRAESACLQDVPLRLIYAACG